MKLDLNEIAARVLVVDDDKDIRELLVEQLQQARYDVFQAGSVTQLRAVLKTEVIDLIVLDLSLPDGDGLKLCQALRAEGFDREIMMVTARASALDRVLGLELGADDYLTKPFEPRELLARIRNLLRRTRPADPKRSRHARYACFDGWRLDLMQRRLIASDGRLVMLSSAEFRLLAHFVEAPRSVLSREQLSPERAATVAFDRSIDLQISRLRQKLALQNNDLILTVRNEGYFLASDVRFE
jgi:two-component system OmpR family response regulator